MQTHYDCKRGQLRVQRNMCKTKGSELISLSKIRRPKKAYPFDKKERKSLFKIEYLAKKKDCQSVLEREVLNEKNMFS